MSYDMIDRFLRNNLNDDDYAEYSAALDELCTPPAQQEPVCDKDPQGCWSVRCQLGKQCKNTPAQRTWVDPNDKAQKQYLPHIGELVLFCHGGNTYTGKHTGGSFQSEVTNQYFNTWECRWMYLPAAHGIKE